MTPSNNPNYEPISIPISYPGAYLYQAPHNLQLTIDKQLVIVFCLKNLPTTGVVLSGSELSIKDLISEVGLLYLKIKSKLKIHTSDISLKLFGLSSGAFHVFDAVQKWAETVGIKITVTELGKSTVRNLSIECKTGKVGVTYGELNKVQSKLIFLPVGTARERIPLTQMHNNILILTHNSVQRQLTRASIEEYPAWAAVSVERVSEYIQSNDWKKTEWSVVLCFEDLKEEKGIEKFIKSIHSSHPSVEIRWVGSTLPQFSKDIPALKLLPPMDYDLLPDFKKMLKRAVFDANLAMNFDAVKIPQKKLK
jgi:hypothetical protein